MPRRLYAIMQKELVQTLRDRRTLGIQLIAPVILLFLFGYAVELQVEHQPTVVVDMSRDRLSYAYVDAMVNTGFFDVVGYADSETAAMQAIDDGRARVAIVIPPNFAPRVERREAPQVLVLIDGADVLGSQSALNATMTTAQRFAADVILEQVERSPLASQVDRLQPLDVRFRVLYNPDMKSIVFMVPGLVGLILQQQTLVLIAFAIVREREVGTIEQLLVTPIRPWELMLGKMIPNILISFVNMSTILVLGLAWFKVPFNGDIWLFFALAFLFVFSSLGLGALVSTLATSQKQAQQLANSIILLAIMLSGYIFPRQAMPPVVQWMGNFIPLTYFLKISRGIMTKGVGLASVQDSVVALVVFGIVVFAISAGTFRTRLD
ncbi:MAG: ABC transporter permease [Anaerolineales bacterium]|nr:ABC transporter permease [Anaerolineales bacterium]